MNANIVKEANIIARKYGTSWATSIKLGRQDKVISYTRPGYRKYTTGQYVPKRYLMNFGWKNTYYQRMHCTVEIDCRFMWE